MRVRLALLLALLPLLGSLAVAATRSISGPPIRQDEVGALERRARETAALFEKAPNWSDEIFAETFRAQVSHGRLRAILRDYYKKCGVVEEVIPMGSDAKYSGSFLLLFEKGVEAHLTLGVNGTPPFAIHTWIIGAPEPSVRTFEELGKLLTDLEGEVSFGVYRLGGEEPEPVFTLAPETALAIGSAFKLYVLGALVEEVAAEERTWADTIQLDAKLRSLPSGFLRSWPAGSSHTIETLAGLMISQSDNTAADHLLFAVGRERVEAELSHMGNLHAKRTIPFLSTAEVFELKWAEGGAPAEAYSKLDTDGRRAYLGTKVAGLSIDDIDPSASFSPTHIDSIEWFASAADLARALDWLRVHTTEGRASRARDLLAINPGVSIPKDSFPYAGYKGGSEPGVMSLNWLLQAASGSWYALTLTRNNPDALLDETQLLGLASRAMGLLAKSVEAEE